MSDTVKSAKKAKVDPNEPKDARFRRLASARGDKLIHQMKLLKNLGTSYAYRLDPDVAEELLSKFDKHVNDLRDTWVAKINEMRKTTEPVGDDDVIVDNVVSLDDVVVDDVEVDVEVEVEEEPVVAIND